MTIRLKKNQRPVIETNQLDSITHIEVIARNHQHVDFSFLKEQINPVSISALTINVKDLRIPPSEISLFYNLKYLKIINSKIEKINFKYSLETIIMPKANLERIPSDIYEMRDLKVLDLNGNRISKVDSKIEKLKNLQRLNLDCNLIENLPESFYYLEKINHLSLDGNPLTEKTKQEIFDHFGIEL
ncbi:leucine-rich repeat domain-containing protein [Halobacteriovorax sp. GB3]|uniref:leucine-rich repeat domain-containing protein n=1 Tax=Halobacteriovorax sp. GB3 TaxID=2719615 RepID=UPI00235E9170|nr:leucine-rich repeat domain-containing protein [Halobacteriovorax sp. GB3]MDD0853077.1 leucine-rich repeat domain-containing protein [Halobacteriovorax sp. GB3]